MAASSIRLRRRLAIISVLMGLSGCLYLGIGAESAEIKRLTDASDLIVLGDLTLNPASDDVPAVANGTIRGRQLIWGDPFNYLMGDDATDLVYKVVWESTGAPLPSKKGVWFVATAANGMQVLEGWTKSSGLVAVRHQLVDQMVLARQLGRSPSGAPIVQLLVRNAHPGDIQVADFRLIRDALHLHPDVTVQAYAGERDDLLMLDPLPGRYLALDETSLALLIPGEQLSVTVDLESIWGPQAAHVERLYFRVHPFGDFELTLEP